MNTEQVIKALECCSKDDCDNCPNGFGNCYANLAGYALALINELQAHNANLIKENKYLRERLAEEMEHKEDMKCGEWVLKDLNNKLYESKKAPHCSVCNYMSFIRHDYCPNCGAKMKGE